MKHSKALLGVFACYVGCLAAHDQGASRTDWPAVGRDSDETYYSPLQQINVGNVDRLGLQWFIDLPLLTSAVSTPLEVGGVLYFAVGHSFVYAAQATTGRVLWKYDPKVTEATNDKLKPAWGIRGLAYGEGRLYVGTQDGRLIALATRDGKLIWSTDTTEPGDGRFITGAPRYFKGKVIIGHGGADRSQPDRGYVTAYDAASGRQRWRFFLVPGDPAKGFESKAMEMAAKTWTGEWWKYGGGAAAWNAITYDSKYDRIYVGTGNGQPWNRNIRSPGGGDNLFVCSIVALDAESGEYLWHYQTTPGESWDYNSAMDIELATLSIDGKPRDVILHAPKNGFFYVIDRQDGRLLSAKPFAHITWAGSVDMKTGKPVEAPEARFPNGETVIYPASSGSHSWMAMSFSPKSRLVYLPTVGDMPGYYHSADVAHWDPQASPNGFTYPVPQQLPIPDTTPKGMLQAWEPVRQAQVWSVPTSGYFDGGVLSTAGDLVFQGTERGNFEARAAASGRLLWSTDAHNGIVAQPISYQLGSKQYIVVMAGYGSAPGMFGPEAARFGWHYRSQKRRVLAYALDGHAQLPTEAPPQPVQPIRGSEKPLLDAEFQAGGRLFTRNCMICHGVGVIAGGSAPDLRGSNIPVDAEAFARVVSGGLLRSQGMPQFDELSAAEVETIRKYIRQEADKGVIIPVVNRETPLLR